MRELDHACACIFADKSSEGGLAGFHLLRLGKVLEDSLALVEDVRAELLLVHDLFQVVKLFIRIILSEGAITIESDCQRAACHLRSLEGKELRLDKGQVQEEARVYEHAWPAHTCSSAVILQERLRRGAVYVKFQDLEDLSLHGTHLSRRERVHCHDQQIRHDGRVNFLELTRNQQGSDAEQLQLIKRQPALAEVAVDDVDCDEERFRQELELNLQYQQPVYESLTLLRRKLWLLSQVVAADRVLDLSALHPAVDAVLVAQAFIFATEAHLNTVVQVAYQSLHDSRERLRRFGLIFFLPVWLFFIAISYICGDRRLRLFVPVMLQRDLRDLRKHILVAKLLPRPALMEQVLLVMWVFLLCRVLLSQKVTRLVEATATHRVKMAEPFRSLVSHIIEPLVDALITHTKIGRQVTHSNTSLGCKWCTQGRLSIAREGCIVAVPP